jgi:hypothetical protein
MSMDRKTGANAEPIAGAPGPHPVGAATIVDTRQFVPIRGLRENAAVGTQGRRPATAMRNRSHLT